MNILHGVEGLRSLASGSILSIGNFDGVHRGHQSLLALREKARSQRPDSRIAITTFEPHPLTVLRPEKVPPRLTPRNLKRELLEEQGVDDLVELAPEPAVLNLTAEQFWAILRDEVRPSQLVEGTEFNFGKGRGGNIDRLREWSQNSNVRLRVIDDVEVALLDQRIVPVSSTVARWLIAYGRVRDAAILLGRPYTLRGEVVKGFQRGRELGVPTANLRCNEQLVPDDAIYAGRCTIDGQTYPAAVSIGTMPTFGDNHQRQIEAHLIGFNGDLYGRVVSVELLDWLREQRKYSGIEPLKEQIGKDIAGSVEHAAEFAAKSPRPNQMDVLQNSPGMNCGNGI